jgi:ABC-type sugar transport system ATPase subunit
MGTENVILRLDGITKKFPGVLALDHVHFELKKGEVHVLLGENGAGKSTLMKILSGVYPKDEGTIQIDGRTVQIGSVKESQGFGISIIYQELNLFPDRTIAQNIFAGRESLRNEFLGWIDEAKLVLESKRLLQMLELDYDPQMPVRRLSIAAQQMVEVVKALSLDTKILIMDEPTSSLTQKEIKRLFEIIRTLKAQGVSIIYISHRMEEIYEIGDRVTVFRDGKYVDTVSTCEVQMDELVALMVGRKIERYCNRTYYQPGAEVLRVSDLTGARFRNVNLQVRAGEIVGIAGLVGAGRTEVAKAIFGCDPVDSGTITFCGESLQHHSVTYSVQHGIGFLPENRKEEGLILNFSVGKNIVHACLDRLFANKFINVAKEAEVAEKFCRELRIKTPNVGRPVKNLSGGNQQKVVIAKWLCAECKFFIFDEPTRGIDVGAKTEIYELMNELAKNGAAILLVSSEQKEILGLCDRIYVMCNGEIVKEFDKDEATQEKVVGYAIGRRQ